MSMSGSPHAELMDGVYRRQRHIYDLTRKYYLLGRDRLIEGLDVPEGGTVLELGCGTGRNLLQAARRYPHGQFYGLDISFEMLDTASKSIARHHRTPSIKLALGDASDFDTRILFARSGFDRVFMSYTLSMIPAWQQTIGTALGCLSDGGSLHIVDFGRQERLPRWFKGGLRSWLATFHVTPRDTLRDSLCAQAQRFDAEVRFASIYGGYAVHAVAARR